MRTMITSSRPGVPSMKARIKRNAGGLRAILASVDWSATTGVAAPAGMEAQP
jgi:hypothetical protein